MLFHVVAKNLTKHCKVIITEISFQDKILTFLGFAIVVSIK